MLWQHTSVWILHTSSCWGSPCGRYEFLPTHRYIVAGAELGVHPIQLKQVEKHRFLLNKGETSFWYPNTNVCHWCVFVFGCFLLTWTFPLIGNDTSDKVRLCHMKVVHQSVQRLLLMIRIKVFNELDNTLQLRASIFTWFIYSFLRFYLVSK